jgi:uncharacterized membrane protein
MQTRKARTYQGTVFFVAGLASLVACALVSFRVLYSGYGTYVSLIWNLFLAWIPWFSALLAYQAFRKANRVTLVVILYSLVWLLFFPNAPYIVTDFLHLQALSPIPIWFDVFLIFAFAWAGLFLGFSSLYTMQRIVTQKLGRILGWVFALMVLALSSFGIYLGRFLRWNSWDVLADPRGLAGDILGRVIHPTTDLRSYAVSFLATVVFATVYLTLYTMAQVPREEGDRGEGHRETGGREDGGK